MRKFIWIIVFLAALAAGYVFGHSHGRRTITTEEQAALERDFERSMSGVVLEGSFTVDGAEATEPRVERYTIESVRHVGGEFWIFNSRLQYGEQDVTLPVPVRILWAGDTPVVTLTDASIPGLGTFTARVLFYRDHYAGMWASQDTGGLQFGRIRRGEADR